MFLGWWMPLWVDKLNHWESDLIFWSRKMQLRWFNWNLVESVDFCCGIFRVPRWCSKSSSGTLRNLFWQSEISFILVSRIRYNSKIESLLNVTRKSVQSWSFGSNVRLFGSYPQIRIAQTIRCHGEKTWATSWNSNSECLELLDLPKVRLSQNWSELRFLYRPNSFWKHCESCFRRPCPRGSI